MGMARTVASAGGMGPGAGVLGLAGAGAAAAMSGSKEKTKSWVVPEGYRGIRMFLGDVKRDKDRKPIPKILPPKRYWATVLTHSNVLVSVKVRDSNIPERSIDHIDKDGNIENRLIGAELRWVVSEKEDHPYRAYSRPDGSSLDNIVVGICGGALKAVMTTIDIDSLRTPVTEPDEVASIRPEVPNDVRRMLDEEVIAQAIYNRVQYLSCEKLMHYGVMITGLSLQEDARSREEVTASGIESGIVGLGQALAANAASPVNRIA